ncbi:hypothetical protein Scep_029700 [Stephania cephalantha]|uniref:Uncharacterized protein n=1 Tax=Stephania cephalantha TaxID=152367 RepID=A0AAP0E5W0_9MAGN
MEFVGHELDLTFFRFLHVVEKVFDRVRTIQEIFDVKVNIKAKDIYFDLILQRVASWVVIVWLVVVSLRGC